MRLSKSMIDPPVFAHRGASFYAPENTFAAFDKAKELGIRWLEFDVMLTADEHVVVIHDETLNRTTNMKGDVNHFLLSEVEKADAGSWFNIEFNQQRVPLLGDVMRWMRDNHMAANIEIKALPGKEVLTAKKVLSLIQENWTEDMLPAVVSSFSLDILYAVRQLDSEVCLGLLMDEWLEDWEKIADELQCVSVHPNQKLMSAERALAIKKTQRLLFCYTVNDAARAHELFSYGVDAVYSDCPDQVIV